MSWLKKISQTSQSSLSSQEPKVYYSKKEEQEEKMTTSEFKDCNEVEVRRFPKFVLQLEWRKPSNQYKRRKKKLGRKRRRRKMVGSFSIATIYPSFYF